MNILLKINYRCIKPKRESRRVKNGSDPTGESLPENQINEEPLK